MKAIDRRLSALEARLPMPDDGKAAVADMLRWALTPELDALQNLLERHHRGQPAAGDDALIEEMTARWQARADDPAVEVSHVHDATRRWHRDPDRRLIGGQWEDWLNAFSQRDEDGTASADDWSTWRRIVAAVDLYIIRQAPLPDGVSWGPGEGMPAALLEVAAG